MRARRSVDVLHGDARELDLAGPFDAVVTSPPYPGLIDYHEQHRYAYELLGLDDLREREIGAACRKVARQVAEETLEKKLTVTAPKVRELLGRPRFQRDVVQRRTREPGVATGLAWTPVGGDVLFVEASAMPGKGRLTITGQVGDVMRESAQAALSYVRGHAREFAPGLPDDYFATHDIHLHVPSGAIPKDGPSAGITMATALMSMVTGKHVRSDTAMTGEITLTGQVLPIGGVREKVLAAQRAGLRRVILPLENEPDLEDLPPEARGKLEFVLVDHVEDVFDHAFRKQRGSRARRPALHRQAAASRR